MNCNSKKKASGKHLPDRIIALLSDSNYIRSLIKKKKCTTHHILLLNTVTVYVIYVKNLFFFLFSEEAKEQEDKTDTATHDGNSVTLALTPKQRHNSKLKL